MANHKSTKKRIRSNKTKNEGNKYLHKTVRNAIKSALSDASKEEKKERLEAIWEMQESVQAEINKDLVGKALEVLIEGKKKDKFFGRTRSDKLVFIDTDINKINELVYVEIEQSTAWSLQGTILN